MTAIPAPFKGLVAILILPLLLTAGLRAQPVDPNFAVDVIQNGPGKTKIAFDAAGRMYVCEKRGQVLLFTPNGSGGYNAPSVLLNIIASVDSGLEAGLLGFEIDPDHANNRFIYLLYTTTTDQRVVRYTMNATFTGIEGGSELVLLSGLPRAVNFHKAGDIGIHPLDPYALFVMVGDDDNINDPQDLDEYVGKILRIDSSTGLGLADNPHWNGVANSVRSRVWARGFRNQFRFVFHPTRADTLFISENGDSTDRVAMVKRGGNGLWNGNDNGGFLTVDTPTFKVLHTTDPSIVGIEIVTSGPFAHNGQPTLYLGEWYGGASGTEGTSRFTLSDSTDAQDDDWDTLTPIAGGGRHWWEQYRFGVDIQMGPDGHLYLCETNGGAAGDLWYELSRYRFANGTPPAASISATPVGVSGVLPYQVDFTDASTAGTNTITSWEWDFGDGVTSTQQNPSHTYTTTGSYTVLLTVTDSVGLSSSAQQQVEVTLNTAVTLDLDVCDGRVLPAGPAAHVFTIAFYQMDGVTPLVFTGGSGSNGNELNTLADGTLDASPTLPLIDSGFVMVLEALAPPGFQEVVRGIAVTPGVSSSVTETFYVSSLAMSGRVLSHTGAPAVVDVAARVSGSALGFAGGRDALPNSQLPTSGVSHRITTDALGYVSIALPTAAAGSTVDLSFAEDTGRGNFATRTLSIVTVAATLHDISITLGEWRGGVADDLSGEAYTPSVPYSAIQAIFSANCTGCHRAGTTNNGGLDLTSGFSYAELVDQPSLFVPGLKLVEPGSPSRSYLFEKINCSNPQQGARMRPSDALPLGDQALIRDWISQLTPSYEDYVWTSLGLEPGSANAGVGDVPLGSATPNGLAYTQPGFGQLAVPGDGSPIQGQLQLNSNTAGLTLVIEASSNLEAGSWTTVASRLRGQASWRVRSGFTMNDATPGVLQFTDSDSSGSARFYRFGVSEE